MAERRTRQEQRQSELKRALESDGRIVIFITSQNKKKKNVGLQLKIGW